MIQIQRGNEREGRKRKKRDKTENKRDGGRVRQKDRK